MCIAFLSISNYTMWEIEKALTTPTAVLSTSIWWRATTTCSSSSTTFWSRLSSEKSSQINHGWSWARCHRIYSSLWNCSGNNNPIFLGEKIIEEKVILRCQIWFAEKHMSIGFYFCTFFSRFLASWQWFWLESGQGTIWEVLPGRVIPNMNSTGIPYWWC